MSVLIPEDGWKNDPPASNPADRIPSDLEWRPATAVDPQKPGTLKLVASFAVAAVADGLNAADFSVPLIYIPVDIVTVLILLALWGMRREIALALVTEMIPALNLFPTWVAVVAYLYFRTTKGSVTGPPA
jgi:hypothetical protein